ncbi:MAG: bifunctional demethylmenaquinone methyltransferase/2-methoxy-6-polyprenyl-1,4-benzoquinol methylase UbiE [Phycisphaerae bacterium]|nr:bifunctional demethylmenaquinone methyltransferase/2-methoxy-6-polyprenyl-1,4-benzoquinol methylase UbiE [Phycisphaerae bacterium]
MPGSPTKSHEQPGTDLTSAQVPAPSSAAPAWAAPDLADPHALADKPARVQRMFGAIAESYDLNNRVHSLGQDQRWRKFAVKSAIVKPGEHVLDVACGTGDLTEAFASSPAAKVTGVDFTRAMLDIAERKRPTRLPPELGAKVSYHEGDAMALRFPAASFDVVSIAFGIRNVADPAKAIAEFFRVLRPGGRLVVLEFDRPRWFPMNLFYDFYCGWVMPRTATLISRDQSGAYRYLPRSVGTFMSRSEMCGRMAGAGFSDVTATGLSLGICVCYRAFKQA